MSRTIRYAFGLCTLAALTACSTPPAAPTPPAAIPAYLQANNGCAIVAGGAVGSEFADKRVETMWDRINGAVTSELQTRMQADNYKTVKLIVPSDRTRKLYDVLGESTGANRCNRVLQVAHNVGEDAQGKYFIFDIALFRIVPTPGATRTAAGVPVTNKSEYQRSYRYARTEESFRNFYTGDFAQKVLADLRASGVLAPLR